MFLQQSAPFCPKYCIYMLHAAPACKNLQGLASMYNDSRIARIPCTQRKGVQKRMKGAHNMKTCSAAESAAETHWPVSSTAAAAAPAHWKGALGSFVFLDVDAPPAPS
uniref:Uncharacterized protein n=1 Tax=Dunaliella tertiolecta TaxID=3047 RepID=A0A7S3VSF1_DUNTE